MFDPQTLRRIDFLLAFDTIYDIFQLRKLLTKIKNEITKVYPDIDILKGLLFELEDTEITHRFIESECSDIRWSIIMSVPELDFLVVPAWTKGEGNY